MRTQLLLMLAGLLALEAPLVAADVNAALEYTLNCSRSEECRPALTPPEAPMIITQSDCIQPLCYPRCFIPYLNGLDEDCYLPPLWLDEPCSPWDDAEPLVFPQEC